MKSGIESSDREFLERLHRLGDSTIQEICAELGVTANAVRQRLVRLQGFELVARELIRTPRGRPHYTYRVTPAGLRQLGDNYADLALILWREMQSIEEPSVRARVASRVEEALVRQFNNVADRADLNDRLAALTSQLQERGFHVEFDRSGLLPVLRENNCPYHELASRDSAICEMEQAVFRRVLGTDIKLTQCCLDGHSCCEFQAAESGPAFTQEAATHG
jgi:predicted ArsR family transcriptional regulator